MERKILMLGGKCSACGERVELKAQPDTLRRRFLNLPTDIVYIIGFFCGALAMYVILN